MSLRQRLEDFLRERRIDRYRRAYRRAACKAPHECTGWFFLMRAEINARSPGQVARMERARGLR